MRQPYSTIAFSPEIEVVIAVVIATADAPAAKPTYDPTSSHDDQNPRRLSGENSET